MLDDVPLVGYSFSPFPSSPETPLLSPAPTTGHHPRPSPLSPAPLPSLQGRNGGGAKSIGNFPVRYLPEETEERDEIEEIEERREKREERREKRVERRDERREEIDE
jgi:hypothetical protein